MKCQNCGKLDANFHYRLNVNGKMTEQHLCQECAATMEDSVFTKSQRELTDGQNTQDSLFYPEYMFGGGSMWDNMTRGFFSDFWCAPQIVMISPSAYQPHQASPSGVDTGAAAKNIPVDAGDKFKKRREINKLRSEMRSAVKDENFESAAELRDRIYSLENECAKDS